MSLLSLWKTNKEDIESKQIQQLVGLAGDGNLKDNSVCSKELREYLEAMDRQFIGQYIQQCLEKSFNNSGVVLQDLVNILGKRLDFDVEYGLYQGRSNQVGFDGLWKAEEGFSLVVEVKTTDAYRITLDTLARYRRQLCEQGKIDGESSILIVVGRNDTGELEAQVRGSRHAWDIRIISVESLLALLKVKMLSENDTSKKVRQLLRPFEYTRLDALVDVIYTTAQDVEESAEVETNERATQEKSANTSKSTWEFTDAKELDAKRDNIIRRFGEIKGKALIKKTRATYWSADRELRVVCTISKPYERENQRYWFVFHTRWEEFLGPSSDSFLVLGGMDLDKAFAIPMKVFMENIGHLNTTERPEGKMYWHVTLAKVESGEYKLTLPRISKYLDISEYVF
ncbi:MAG: hypothetical protein OEZ43_11415 [Gammaproteobacteria bacterium]|nr:hypothetical protein [Gammaproteobacteria bacterium]